MKDLAFRLASRPKARPFVAALLRVTNPTKRRFAGEGKEDVSATVNEADALVQEIPRYTPLFKQQEDGSG